MRSPRLAPVLRSSLWLLVGSACMTSFVACRAEPEPARAKLSTARAGLVGDLVLDQGEQCDDGNTWGGDGCDEQGQIEAGWDCTDDNPVLTVVNGNFEAPSGPVNALCPPNTNCFNLTGDLLTGFVIDVGNADFVMNQTAQTSWYCSNSDGCVDLSGSTRGSLYQDVVTVPGRTYRVHFDLAVNGVGTRNMAVSVANGDLPPYWEQHYASSVSVQQANAQYDRSYFTFTASSALTRLRFIGTDMSATGAFVDNIVVPPSTCHPSTCGNGALDAGETCDDGNFVSGDGCSALCQIEHTFTCGNPGVLCTPDCGDGTKTLREACDDGNNVDGDGCSANCTVEAGFNCNFANVLDFGTTCVATVCGDGQVDVPQEGCDDGRNDDGDGCDANCQPERGYVCVGEPSACATHCGDGVIAGNEACDDNGNQDGDGCSANCTLEAGFDCAGEPSACTPKCGDGLVRGNEACDDGRNDDGDGCSANCTLEAGFDCAGEPSVCTPAASSSSGGSSGTTSSSGGNGSSGNGGSSGSSGNGGSSGTIDRGDPCTNDDECVDDAFCKDGYCATLSGGSCSATPGSTRGVWGGLLFGALLLLRRRRV